MADTTAATRFGDPPSVQRLGTALQGTASRLDRLQAMLNGQVTGLVPEGWSGAAAQAFAQNWQRQRDATGQLGGTMNVLSGTMRTLSMALAAAKARFEAAQRMAQANRLVITPELVVMAVNPSDQQSVAMVPVVQAEVDAAWAMAEAARQTAEQSNQAVLDGLLRILDILLTLLGGLRGGGRRIGSTRRPVPSREEAWRQREREIEEQRRRAWERHERVRDPRFRQEMERMHGPPPADGNRYAAHHNFPVENSAEFRRLGIEPNNPAWGSWVREADHRGFSDQLRRDWNSFFANNPGATRQQAFDFARDLGRKYGYPTPF